MSTQAFRLSDLLGHDAFGLKLVSGDDDAPRRVVSGVHTVESAKPTQWLAPSWVMLTLGMRLRGSAQKQRALIAELDEAGIAALGFAIGIFEQLPKPLVEEARARKFPVFAVPFETNFREITTFANRALLSSDLRIFQRLSSIQRHLVDALREQDPEESLVRRLSAVMEADALLLGADGTIQACAGRPPVAKIMARLRAEPLGRGEHTVDDYRFVATSVAAADGPTGWLVFGRQGTRVEGPLMISVLQVATPLFAAVGRLREAGRLEDYAAEQQLLEEILAGESDGSGTVAARAAARGMKFDDGVRVISIRPTMPSDVAEAGRSARAILRAAGVPHIIAVRTTTVIALVELARPELDRVLDPLSSGLFRCAVGIGRCVRELRDAVDSLRDAELTLERLRDEPPAVAAFEDLDLVTLLLAQAPSKRLGQQVEEILETLRSHPSAYDAVVSYLQNRLSVNDAARALFLHPNTIRYRLGKAEELLGRSIRDPATIVDLHIALVVSGAISEEPEHQARRLSG